MGGRRARDEYSVRDDDRGTPHSGKGARGTSGHALIVVLGLLVTGAVLGYGMLIPGEITGQAKPETTIGSTR